MVSFRHVAATCLLLGVHRGVPAMRRLQQLRGVRPTAGAERKNKERFLHATLTGLMSSWQQALHGMVFLHM